VAIAFFDLDLTLLSVNSAGLWVRSERRRGHISSWQALRAASWLARYRLGFSSMERAIGEAISTLRGQSEREVRERTVRFYEDRVRRAFRPGGLAALADHRRAGDRCVLLTSSSNYISELVTRDLGLDGAVCNRFEVDGAGRYTGRSAGPLCFGRGKLDGALALARAQGVDLSACTFYTDSFSDLPALLAVGAPVAVNPDYRLRRWARRRGWPIVDWGMPGRSRGSPLTEAERITGSATAR
jgi:HAD superfamily hydrolase (TIGR01490 family)